MLYSVKVVNRNNNSMLNMCDPELLDKTVKDGKTEIKINSDFYNENTIDENEAKQLLQSCTSANLVGEKIISLSTGLGIGSNDAVKKINNIPFLIVFKM